jgi:glucan phosphorylase
MRRPGESTSQTAKVAHSRWKWLNLSIHAYSAGLGVLAGDTLRSAADQGVPMVTVTLAHRKGYFRQRWVRRKIRRKLKTP